MPRRLMDVCPMSGLRTYHEYDHAARETIISYEEPDVGPALEISKALANDPDYSRRGRKACWWHVAQIPLIVQLKWLHDHGINVHDKNHWPKVRALLNDPEWQYLRTSTGRI